ncbi:MAG TPA: metallophosphatase domain-containing protein [Pyrinomonadaceae bacterium]
MKIVCISDTHTFESQITVPDGDVLIHAGDATITGTPQEVAAFGKWLDSQPHKHKIFIAGNHDWLFERNPEQARYLIQFAGVHYLQDSSVEIDGIRFYGSPWQPRFGDWAFNVNRGRAIRQKWDLIEPCDVLITHGPPWGVLDTVLPNSKHLGCEELGEAVGRVRPRVHVYGHIHGGAGQYIAGGTRFINASICNEAYQITNAPIVFEVEPEVLNFEAVA